MTDHPAIAVDAIVAKLTALYEQPFGGKKRGRFRISTKLMCRLAGRRRLWREDIEAIRRGLYENGYLLVDMDTFFAIVGQQTFASYRRANEASLVHADHGNADGSGTARRPAVRADDETD